MQGLPTITLAALALAFLPGFIVLAIMRAWSLDAAQALWANVRMLVQLLAVGYGLTYLFTTDSVLLEAAVLMVMIGAAAMIALRPLKSRRARHYVAAVLAIGVVGLLILLLVTQLVLELPRWFEPRFVIPMAGMIFANAMNTVSLAAERFESETGRGMPLLDARKIAMDAAMIPQVNALMAVGLVSLPGMMTGQILSGVDPLIAVRYQIVVMCMIFGSAGSAAAWYLTASCRPH